MMEHDQFQEIPLAAVDLDDHPCAPPGPAAAEGLLASLREVGLFSPPWLRGKPGGRWQVVAGRKRLVAAAQLGWKTTPARTLPPATPDAHCLLVALHDNAFGRGFGPDEQIFLAARLMEHWDRATVARKFLPLLGLPPSGAHLHRLLRAARLEAPWLELARQGRLALTAAAAVSEWRPEDRQAAFPYLAGLPFSQSKQEEFLEEVGLLARREGVAPAAILSESDLARHLNAAGSPQERAAAVRDALKSRVSPRLRAAREALQAHLSRLGLQNHPRLRLQPPPAFEGPDFLLELKFQDARELERLLEELRRLVRREEFAGLTSW